ncbi:MAG: hypothetical protein J6R47_03610 [Acholeplasmatales bacterium]|nr:hypothetical protein [Acholeplasmatales bacterium]
MDYFYEEELENYEHFTNEELLALWKNQQDQKARVVLAKRNHNIKGDFFVHQGYIINLEAFLQQNENSTARTIEEAGAEYLAQLEAQEQQAQEV